MRKFAILFVALCAISAAAPAAKHKKRGRTSHVTHARRSVRRTVPATARSSARHSVRPKVQPVQHVQAGPTPERYKEIQQALAEKGYYKGEVNGQWGAESTTALQRFQEEQKLRPDGKLSSLSLIALGLGPKRTTAQTRPPE